MSMLASTCFKKCIAVECIVIRNELHATAGVIDAKLVHESCRMNTVIPSERTTTLGIVLPEFDCCPYELGA